MASAVPTFNKIERAHQMYRNGEYENALELYTQALVMAKTKTQKIALHSNRAACYLKLHDFKKAADECTSVLSLDHLHTGALMLRAQTLVALKEYHSALFDVNRLIELNPESDVYLNLQARLKTQLSLAPIPESEEEEAVAAELERRETQPILQRCQQQYCQRQRDLTQQQESHAQNVAVDGLKSKGSHAGDFARLPPSLSKSAEESDFSSRGWESIPKPRGHSTLDYSRWNRVDDGSSEEEEEDSPPQYRFRVKRVGLQPVK